MKFNNTGREIVAEAQANGKEKGVEKEVENFQGDVLRAKKGRILLKQLVKGWDKLTRGDKIQKGKRFKHYVVDSRIKGITIIKDKKNQPIEYYVS